MLYKGYVTFRVDFDNIQFIGHPMAPLIVRNMCAKQVEATIRGEINYTTKNNKDWRFKVGSSVHFDKDNLSNKTNQK